MNGGPRTWRLAMLATILTAASLVASPASAEPLGDVSGGDRSEPAPRNPGTVTLLASPTAVDFGDPVQLTGSISPVVAGETITVKDGGGATVATAISDASGNYATSFIPDSNVTLHAEWGADSSATLDVAVHAVVTVKLRNVRLFGRAEVSGTIAPASCSASVTVKLLLGDDGKDTAHPATDCSGAFLARMPVEDIGKYRATATYSDPQHAEGTATSEVRETPLPTLHTGSHGVMVGLLEKRLVDLNYHLVRINNGYDHRTADAVLAFRKVQGMARTDDVTEAVWRALADPRRAQPKQNLNGRYIEVDLSKQVLYVVDDGEVTYVLHVSTGKPTTPTPPGHYRIIFKRPGMNASGMYYSSYFLEHFAIHGYASVPPYNASHGCVRVPNWTAKWMYGLAKVGTRMAIYG